MMNNSNTSITQDTSVAQDTGTVQNTSVGSDTGTVQNTSVGSDTSVAQNTQVSQNEIQQSQEACDTSRERFQQAKHYSGTVHIALEQLYTDVANRELPPREKITFDNVVQNRKSEMLEIYANPPQAAGISREMVQIISMDRLQQGSEVHLSNLRGLLSMANFRPDEATLRDRCLNALPHLRHNLLNSRDTHLDNLSKVKTLEERFASQAPQTPGDFIDSLPSEHNPMDDVGGGD